MERGFGVRWESRGFTWHGYIVMERGFGVRRVQMMAEKSSSGVSSRQAMRRKERAAEKNTETEVKEEQSTEDGEKAEVNGTGGAVANGDAAMTNGAASNGQDKPEPMELPPFETFMGSLHFS
ncbi:hypothetical protein NFI96_002716 [Prochilodus magdalenae]|nr:hypothetical protein NFI96_002716 [Prochilodus magdalenae]